MSSSFFKITLAFAIAICVISQATTAPTSSGVISRSLSQPDPSWSDYQVKSCCPKGFI
jgi:hypothetical protein